MKSILKIALAGFGIVLLAFVGISGFVFYKEKVVQVELSGLSHINKAKIRLRVEEGTILELGQPTVESEVVTLTSKGTNHGVFVEQMTPDGQWKQMAECGYLGFLFSFHFKVRIGFQEMGSREPVTCLPDLES